MGGGEPDIDYEAGRSPGTFTNILPGEERSGDGGSSNSDELAQNPTTDHRVEKDDSSEEPHHDEPSDNPSAIDNSLASDPGMQHMLPSETSPASDVDTSPPKSRPPDAEPSSANPDTQQTPNIESTAAEDGQEGATSRELSPETQAELEQTINDWNGLNARDQVTRFENFPTDGQVEVMDQLDETDARQLWEDLGEESQLGLWEELNPESRLRFWNRLDDEQRVRLLTDLDPTGRGDLFEQLYQSDNQSKEKDFSALERAIEQSGNLDLIQQLQEAKKSPNYVRDEEIDAVDRKFQKAHQRISQEEELSESEARIKATHEAIGDRKSEVYDDNGDRKGKNGLQGRPGPIQWSAVGRSPERKKWD